MQEEEGLRQVQFRRIRTFLEESPEANWLVNRGYEDGEA